ncbi:CHAP domain-containing protein [Sanguibacter sp. A247]|uniref:CHAP domain-containing protein n=1 Tax=unclassified Sanguibacter TaxID=2645534 RepID=UPI003FD86243
MSHRSSRPRMIVASVLAAFVAVAGLVPPGSIERAEAAESRPSVSIAVSSSGRFLAGERLWVAGRVRGASSGRSVKVQVRAEGASRWTTVSRGKTRGNGKYTLNVRPTSSGKVRVVASGGGTKSRASASRSIKRVSGSRSLASRARQLDARLGRSTGARHSLTKAQRTRTKVKGVRSVSYRKHSKGMLVEVRTSSARRTWVVSGTILKRYLADDGPKGRWGVPTTDARCGLAESGCVQSFSRGTLYAASGDRTASSSGARGRKGEVIAAARSQVGYADRYRGTGPHTTKYNRWISSSAAWCSIFLSWAGNASGNRAGIPIERNYSSFVRSVRATLPTGSTPRAGAIAFISTRPPHSSANHVALVTNVTRGGRTLNVIHGNYGPGGGRRGVTEQKWPSSYRVLFYAYPRY